MSNHQEFNPKRSATIEAGIVSLFALIFLGTAITILFASGTHWIWGGSLVIALFLVPLLYRSIWRSSYKKEKNKEVWANNHSLTIKVERLPLSPPTNVQNWHYGFAKNGSGSGLIPIGILLFGLPCVTLIVFYNKLAPPEIGFLILFFSLGLSPVAYSFIKAFQYRNLDIRLNKKKVSPGEKVRVVVKQPDKKPVKNLQVALLSRVEHYDNEGTSYETLVVVPILEFDILKPENDGRILDFEFEVPDCWPRTQNFPHFRVSSNIITEIRLRQQCGKWPALSEHFPVEVLEPAPSILDLDWPLGKLQDRLKQESKKSAPAVLATLTTLAYFIGFGILGGFIFGFITLQMPDKPSGLLIAIWLLLLIIYIGSLTVGCGIIWWRTFKNAKQNCEKNQ